MCEAEVEVEVVEKGRKKKTLVIDFLSPLCSLCPPFSLSLSLHQPPYSHRSSSSCLSTSPMI